MLYYFIVVHTDKFDYNDIIPKNYLKDSLLITHEYGKSGINPHFHIIQKSNITTHGLRFAYNKINERKIKISLCKDLEKSVQYILKDGDVKYNSMFSDEEIKEYKMKVKVIQNEYKKEVKTNNYKMILDQYQPIEIGDDIYDLFGNLQMDKIHNITTHLYEFILSHGEKYAWYSPQIIEKMIYTGLMRHYPVAHKYLINQQVKRLKNIFADNNNDGS